jgi:SAM-dependent methyltransferase
MKLGLIAENQLEWLVIKLGLAPTPFTDNYLTLIIARAGIAATRLGVFEALAGGPLTAAEVAARCQSQPAAMETLLNTLLSLDYLRLRGGRYALKPRMRQWLLRSSPTSLHDVILFRDLNWEWMLQLEDFVRTGRPVDIHGTMQPAEWELYQKGMRNVAALGVPETVRVTPVPPGARDMLDIGGSHGFYSVAFCRRYPALRSTVLDLPQAIEHAAPLLAQEHMGDRVQHRAGNALTDDLGVAAYDFIFMAQVVHLFTDADNRALAHKIARALRPGGHFVIQDALRRRAPTEGGQSAALLELFFALTANAGLWTFADMASWQRAAGLIPRPPIRFLTIPGVGEQVGVKPKP